MTNYLGEKKLTWAYSYREISAHGGREGMGSGPWHKIFHIELNIKAEKAWPEARVGY